MIPKIIHYCWFGGNPLNELSKKCIESWKLYCPDYEIIEWNEANFDIHLNRYVEDAYSSKKWAFVSDVARLYAIVSCGGIYLDTDVEIIKPIDFLLSEKAFTGFESAEWVSTCIIGCERNNPVFTDLLKSYNQRTFINDDGSINMTTNPVFFTQKYLRMGLVLNNTKQTVEHCTVYPSDYFCPKNLLGELNVTENTCTIHHFSGSWLPLEVRKANELSSRFFNILPRELSYKFFYFCTCLKYKGIRFTIIKICKKYKCIKRGF